MSLILGLLVTYLLFCAAMEIARINLNPWHVWGLAAQILMFPITIFWLIHDIAQEAAL